MSKVGLAIVTYVNNFGSFLQAYATQMAVQKLGYETEVINISGVQKHGYASPCSSKCLIKAWYISFLSL